MNKKIKSALISVFYKDGLQNIVQLLHSLDIKIYSTGGTQKFIEDMEVSCIAVESLTSYPSILGGRVKTLHPSVFGGILGRRENEKDIEEMAQYNIPEIDLVIVDLYPFEETVLSTNDEAAIIEKIDIGGPSMIRAAAKNFKNVIVVAAKKDYYEIENILSEQKGETTFEQRKDFAIKAFDVCTGYDIAISNYFNKTDFFNPFSGAKNILRYGENPHQQAVFYGDINKVFDQLNGKELSYNNLVDVDAAIKLINDISSPPLQKKRGAGGEAFAIIKHTNVCGVAIRETLKQSWDAALQGDPESAFGGVLITNSEIDKETASAINELFFEVLIAPSFNDEALQILKGKKNRILLQYSKNSFSTHQSKSVLNGTLTQQSDEGNYAEWKEEGGRTSTQNEKEDLEFANIICKHLKSNAIALIKNKQIIGKGCGQTSRIDALRQAIEKAKQFNFDLDGAVLASDAFFPFDDCVKIAHVAGITAFIQPGGSIRDKDSIEYCKQNDLVMVITGMRHFKH
ncbi:MAG: bifunctional phosphoribosylaminoimidazolecarboxamide formyltransferase/IMP cyclohydrolase [Ginsengibacter sp.]